MRFHIPYTIRHILYIINDIPYTVYHVRAPRFWETPRLCMYKSGGETGFEPKANP